MKAIKQLLVLVTFGLLASTASGALIPLGEGDTVGNPSEEKAEACLKLAYDTTTCNTLIYDYKFEPFEYPGFPTGDKTGLVSTGTYSLANYKNDTPASIDLTWALTGTGYGLYAIGLKTGTSGDKPNQDGGINWYGLDDDMRIAGTAEFESIFVKNSISHITLFVRAFDGGPPAECPPGTTGTPGNCVPDVTVPEPGTLGLLGLGLLGLGLRRRNKV